MAFKLTKVNNLPGEKIILETDDIPESANATNLWYTDTRAETVVQAHRETSPTIQDKHFYTVGEVAVKIGDLYWQIISPIEILQTQLYLKTPSSGSNLSVNIIKNGGGDPANLLYNLELIAGDNIVQSNSGSATLQAGDYLQVDVLQVGSATSGSDMIVSFKYRSII